MANETKISALLNDLWIKFTEKESSKEVDSFNVQIVAQPPDEEKKIFTTALQSCQKDMRDTHAHNLPRRLIYWRHPGGDQFFTIGLLDPDDCVVAFYTVDVEEDVTKRWPKEPTHYMMFRP